MNIKPAIYESLTPAQRVSVYVEAIKRGDPAEAERLIACVPRKVYDMPESGFTDAVINQILSDPEIQEKADACKKTLLALNRKENSSGIIVQIINGLGEA